MSLTPEEMSDLAVLWSRATPEQHHSILAALTPTDSSPEPDVNATFPLDLGAFLAGLDSPNHSEQSRRDWVRLFFRDMQRAAIASTPSPETSRETFARAAADHDIGAAAFDLWPADRLHELRP